MQLYVVFIQTGTNILKTDNRACIHNLVGVIDFEIFDLFGLYMKIILTDDRLKIKKGQRFETKGLIKVFTLIYENTLNYRGFTQT